VKARVIVYPRPEILDPQGKAIKEALARLGFDQVRDLRAGKSFDLELAGEDAAAARADLEEMCRRLLSNPLVESYSIELAPEGAAR
jgi:phosphoribosylformylglycinamidine synthase